MHGGKDPALSFSKGWKRGDLEQRTKTIITSESRNKKASN